MGLPGLLKSRNPGIESAPEDGLTVLRVPAMLLTVALMAVLAVPSSAQSPNTATITVIVEDQTGGALPGAEISLTNAMTGLSRNAVSASDGSATIPALSLTGTYELAVRLPGFSDELVKDIGLRAGENAVFQVRLKVGAVSNEVSVYGTVEGVRSDAELGTRLDSDRIDATPVLGRKVTALPLLNAAFRSAKGTGDLFVNSVFFVTGAGGRRQPDFVIDGATANEPWGRQTMVTTVPVAAVQEMNVQSRAFSPEFGWTSSAAVNFVTEAGTNATHADFVFLGRPGRLQAKTLGTGAHCPSQIPGCVRPATPIIPADVPDSLGQGSFAVGGPIRKDRTHYFVAMDYTHQDRIAPVTTPLVAAGTSFTGNYRQGLVNARLDHRTGDRHAVMLRFNLDRFHDTNPQDAVSGNVLPSAARRYSRRTYSIQINETSVLSKEVLNEGRFIFLNASPVTAFDPLTPSTQFTRAGSVPFTSGESRFSHVFSRQGQFSDTLSWTRRRHYIRVGGSIAHNTSGGDGTEFGSAFVLGQYTVNTATTAPPEQLTLANMTRYQQSFSFGKNKYVLKQWLLAGFAQDRYRVRNDLTIDFGLRYDRQTFSDGRLNFAPRIGFGWHPAGRAESAVRGGYGIYYTQLRANIDASFELGGPEGVFTYQAAPGQTGFPACLACTPVAFDTAAAAATLPARNITIRPAMASFYSRFFNVLSLPGYAATTFVNPRSQVASIGVDERIKGRLYGSVDYVRQHWTGLDQTIDLNAPTLFARTAPGQVRTTAAADATRPIVPANGGFRAINVVTNRGVADYDGLQTSLRWQHRRAFLSVSYTLSKATNTTEPDGNGAGQNDFNQLGPAFERAPSLLDQRHRGVISFSYRLPYNITAGTLTQLASARPFNPTTGTDNNGDGNNNDRPVINGQIAGRYSLRGTPTKDVSIFVEHRVIVSERTLLVRLEGFNVLNHANILARNGTYGDGSAPLTTFGQASPGLAAVDPARMFQVQLRYSF